VNECGSIVGGRWFAWEIAEYNKPGENSGMAPSAVQLLMATQDSSFANMVFVPFGSASEGELKRAARQL